MPLQLRRTASALATKFARRFKSNSPACRIQALKVPISTKIAPKWDPINAKQEEMLLENSLYGSIYVQMAEKRKQKKSNRSQSNSSGDKSKSKSPTNAATSSRLGAARPSYAEPTRKDLLPRKELNRPKIAKAIESLRHQ